MEFADCDRVVTIAMTWLVSFDGNYPFQSRFN